MSALILKSGNALISGIESIDFATYKNRVLSDGGMIVNEQAVREAFAFAVSKGLGSSEVFSATSASWGVKIVNGKPSRFYSLFGGEGDIGVTISSSAAIFYNTDRYDVPVLELKGSSGNAIKSSGVANGVNNSGLCVVARTPTIAAADYGGIYFALAELADLSPATSSADATGKRVHAEIFRRTNISHTPELWKNDYLGYGDEGSTANGSDLVNPPSFWVRSSSFLQDGKLAEYDNGVEVTVDNVVRKSSYVDNLSFNLGRARNTGGTGISYGSPFYGDIAEAWCLINTTENKMKALSLYAHEKYSA